MFTVDVKQQYNNNNDSNLSHRSYLIQYYCIVAVADFITVNIESTMISILISGYLLSADELLHCYFFRFIKK